MIRTGLVSITFRQLSSKKIIELVSKAGLDAIEWGGDIHVPHGNLDQARDVRKQTDDAGLQIAAFGSYYKVGESETEGLSFDAVLDTTCELDAPRIRVWAGSKGTDAASSIHWEKVIADGKRIAEKAAAAGKQIAFEFHGNSLTDHAAAAIKLHNDINHDNVKMYWQPLSHNMPQDPKDDLAAILPILGDIHVFAWLRGQDEHHPTRLALQEGYTQWVSYFKMIKDAEHNCTAMLEFAKNDSPDQFLADAATLKQLLHHTHTAQK
ncbi:sugar phosphate isomerase/epimerase family protein [Poriferisphaera sp. WC338]|uniref:sugar phosphate isomerase/epimerase family protein n=1 Tax=Poriferisphaera sp. WC338 TaxID=3425129 RepID=UPI003D81B9F2